MTMQDPTKKDAPPAGGATIYRDDETAATTPPTGATVYDRPESTGGPNMLYLLIAVIVIALLAVAAWNFLM